MAKTRIQIDRITENTKREKFLNSDKLDNMSLSMKEICDLLSQKNKNFDSKETFLQIIEYVKAYDRLLYGDISSYCFSLKQEEMDNFNGNLIRLVIFTESEDFSTTVNEIKQQYNLKDDELCDKAKRIVIKMYDHVNLASVQLNDLKKDDKDLEIKIEKQLIPVREEIVKDMSAQLISLVAIFTAVAFVVFGGFSSLSSIFSNIKENPEKLIMIVSIWGLAICNIVYILMYSIGHLLKVNKAENDKVSLVPVQLVKWTNLILCSIGAISAWLYFVDINNIGKWFVLFSQKNSVCVSIVGVLIIIVISIIIGVLIFKNKNNNDSK